MRSSPDRNAVSEFQIVFLSLHARGNRSDLDVDLPTRRRRQSPPQIGPTLSSAA